MMLLFYWVICIIDWWFNRLLAVKMELRCIYIFTPMRWGINDYEESFMMIFSDRIWDVSIFILMRWGMNKYNASFMIGFIFPWMILGMCQWDEAHPYAFYSMYEGYVPLMYCYIDEHF